MIMKSSTNLGTEQENKTETVMGTRKSKATPKSTETETPSKAESAAEELVAERLPDEVEASVEANTDAVVETAAKTIEATTFEEILADGRERIDAIDDQILELIELRMTIAGTLLAEKHSRRMNPRDKVRQMNIYDRLSAQAAEFKDNGVNLNKHQIREVFELLIRLGVENHRQNIINRR